MERLAMGSAIGTACQYSVEDCLAQSVEEYKNYPEKEPDRDQKRTTYCYGIQEGGKAEWDLMWSRYGEEIDANELSTMRFALSCSKEYQTLQKYLEIAISDEIRVQDKHYVFNYVSKSLYGRDVAWKFIQTNWQWFYDM